MLTEKVLSLHENSIPIIRFLYEQHSMLLSRAKLRQRAPAAPLVSFSLRGFLNKREQIEVEGNQKASDAGETFAYVRISTNVQTFSSNTLNACQGS